MGRFYMQIPMGKNAKAQEERRWVRENDRYNKQIKINKTTGTDTMRINGKKKSGTHSGPMVPIRLLTGLVPVLSSPHLTVMLLP